MESFRPEYWNELPCPPPGGGLLEDAGLNPSILNASMVTQLVKNPLTMQETLVQFLGQEDTLENG